MTDRAALDAAALHIITACRNRRLDAAAHAVAAEVSALIDEGHAEALVCQAEINAIGTLLGESILGNCDPSDVGDMWRECAEVIGSFVLRNGQFEAAVQAGVITPMSATVQ